MKARELQQAGYLYPLDEELLNAHNNAKRLTRLLNATLETERPKRSEIAKELFGQAGEGVYIEPPFHCDYGCNTRVGKNFYCNYDCVFLDCGNITIGDNTVIGAGSVVTKAIPANVVAAGNPCRVIRPITEEDAKYWSHQLELTRKLLEESE